jgi:hypothetical protein
MKGLLLKTENKYPICLRRHSWTLILRSQWLFFGSSEGVLECQPHRRRCEVFRLANHEKLFTLTVLVASHTITKLMVILWIRHPVSGLESCKTWDQYLEYLQEIVPYFVPDDRGQWKGLAIQWSKTNRMDSCPLCSSSNDIKSDLQMLLL